MFVQNATFKKVKRKVRKIRKKKALKADDLLPLPDDAPAPHDLGNRFVTRLTLFTTIP